MHWDVRSPHPRGRQRTASGHRHMLGRGLYTGFLWKLVLPLDGLTAPRALGDVGLCGWNNREESPAEESGRNHAYAEPFPDR